MSAEDRPRRWWEDMILYQCHLPSLRDGNGDGIGDLEGLVASLDYLADTLGVTAIWTGPFFRSPLLDQGYDISDHCDVEPRFGDLATVDRLIAEAHARGIRVIIDYVPNHTSDQHPWFLESRASRSSEKRDWYIWADAPEGRDRPNNWISEAGGSVWEWDDATAQFYLHSHLKEQPDLNWRSPELRSAMLDVMRFWLDRGVDGFRVDVAHMLMKDPDLRDNPPNPGGQPNPWDLQHADFSSQLHVHDRMHPDLHGVLREMRSVVDAYEGERSTIGEIEAMEWSSWAKYFGADLDEVHLPFAFKLIETPWTASDLRESIEGMEGSLPTGGWPVFALGNHDRPRLVTRLGPAQARVAAILLLTLRGTPTILYADELGLLDQLVPADRQRDFFGLAAGGVSRDPARTPMAWNDQVHGGFAPAAAPELWLPVWQLYRTHNVQAQLADDGSFLTLYRRLIALRRTSPALTRGRYSTHESSDSHCLVYLREHGDERQLIALNLSDQARRLAIEESGHVAVNTLLDRVDEAVDGHLNLRANEGAVLRLTARQAPDARPAANASRKALPA